MAPAARVRRALVLVRRLVAGLAFVYVGIALFAFFGTDRLLFQPHAPGYTVGPDITMLTTTAGGRVAAKHVEAPGARYTVLLSHGNAEDLGDMGWLIDQLRSVGLNVFAYDYEGYGVSGGAPSEARFYADVDAAYAYLTEEKRIPPGRIIAYGRSIGGGPAVDLASRKPLGGLILESTFTSVFRVVTQVRLFPGDPFQNLAKMPLVRCPVLVMHGARDDLIPFHHGEALFAAAGGTKRALWVPEAGHTDVAIVAGGAYEAAIRELLRLAE